MEQVTISTGAYGWSTLIVAHFSLAYNLEPAKVQEELRKGLRNCQGAKGITVEPVKNNFHHVYKVTFPNQCIDGIALTVGMIAGVLEELEGEVREAVRVKELIRMIKEN